MDKLVEGLFQKILDTGQCGVGFWLLLAGLLYQTWRLGKSEERNIADRKQMIEMANTRTAAAEAQSTALRELAMVRTRGE